jgi:serine/threonine-protein kinase
MELPRHVAMGFQHYSSFKPFEEGGVAKLQECFDKNLGRRVLMKSLHPHLKDNEMEQRRFLREARVTAQLQHPATVPVYELGRDREGALYFTMKRVRGTTLRKILEELAGRNAAYTRTYPLDQRLEIFIQVCLALAYAHAQGVIHRDLKPANVIIGEFDEVMLLDWGLAKVFDEAAEDLEETHSELASEASQETSAGDLGLTKPGKRYGTPLYMSPEQAMGNTDVDERCDIYLLGSVLYEILSLKPLMWGDNMEEVLNRVINEEPLSPMDKSPACKIPPELDAICMKCLSKRPEDRYETVMDLVADIRRFRRDQPVSVYKDSLIRHLLKWRQRHILSTRVILAFLLGVVLTLLYLG